jgi:hypothetical protein
MSSAEFAKLKAADSLLTYNEAISITLNQKNSGVLTVPKSISSNTQPRKHNSLKNFNVIGSPDGKCDAKISMDTYDVFTTTILPNVRTYNVLGVQIPIRKREANASECAEATQHFTLYVLDSDNKLVHSEIKKEEIKTCDNQPTGWTNANAYYPRPDWQLVNVRFNQTIVLTQTANKLHKFKVVFHDTASYPSSLGTGDFRLLNVYQTFVNTGGYYWFFGKDTFVYSMITQTP